WDRLMRAGRIFGLEPAGTEAMDILDLEAGIARPERDYAPARDGSQRTPTPKSLGLESLIDPSHQSFNGRSACLSARETRTLVGIEIDSETPAPHTPLMRNGHAAGRTLSSHYSPALRRAIALAIVDAGAGAELSLTLSPSAEIPEFRTAAARVTALPFLPIPDSMGA
ncbi:MAG TPA: glycine cleavage T C-terminal barrel domain-containing protein, partial [Rhizomicrobium sp.]|nr:glycine cleavage T C-terminal barrel domain-containing protein [Rhizomicrobium sp.]